MQQMVVQMKDELEKIKKNKCLNVLYGSVTQTDRIQKRASGAGKTTY
jgi:hypothetical protein